MFATKAKKTQSLSSFFSYFLFVLDMTPAQNLEPQIDCIKNCNNEI